MSFHLTTSNHTEELLEHFIEESKALPGDPFEEDVVVVPGDGLRAWITREVARRRGICANLRFLSPERAIWMLANSTNGTEGKIEGNLFSKERLAWKIRGVLPELLASGNPDILPVGKYLDEANPLKTIQFCWQIATAFDGYLNYRPGLVDGWAAGGSCANQDEAWQSLLWQAIRDEFPPTLAKLCKQNSFASGSPSRLWVFGLSHLPPIHLEVFKAYAREKDLRYLLLQPSDGYWGDVLSERKRKKELAEASMSGREELTEADLYLDLGPRLLGGLGKTGQTFIEELSDANPIESPCAFSEREGNTLLGDLQRCFRELQSEEEMGQKPAFDKGDRSIQVHSSHGPARELEALREFLLGLFDGDSGLRPSDILVLTPSIKNYAPLVPAVFGNPEEPHQRIPYGVCDREWRNESRVMDTFYSLLEFAEGRASARDTIELIDRPSMRDRFDLDDDEVELIRWWIDHCAVAWGYDGEHKEALELPPSEENTWSHGLGRMLLGFCMDAREERTFAEILPFDEIEGRMGETLAKLVEIVRLLEELHQAVRIHRKPRGWKGILEKQCLDAFFLDDESTHADLTEIRKSLQFLEEETTEESVPESLASIRHHLLLTVSEKAGFSRHLSHGVTFASMRSARCVPARVICLIGLNGRQFPGRDTRPSFDLTRNKSRPTDRDSTGEDRLLVLENILSARDILYLSYQGQSNKDNQEIPPSVVVPEILEELENLRDFGNNLEGKPNKAEKMLVTIHPLQAFGRKYFTAHGDTTGSTGEDEQEVETTRPQSYSKANLEAAKALTRRPLPLPPFSTEPLPPPAEEYRHVLLKDLARFWKTPCEYFLRQRIGMDVWEQSDLLPDREMLEPGGLEKYQLRIRLTRLLQSEDGQSAQAKVEKAKDTLRKEGLLPPGEPGEALFHEILVEAEDFLQTLNPYVSIEKLPSHGFSEKIGLFELTGEVEPMHGNTLLAGRPAITKAKDLMEGWILHLAANAFGPLLGDTTTVVAGTEEQFTFSPSGQDEARETLDRLLELYWEGLCRPLLFFPETSSKWLETMRANEEVTEESGKRKDPLDAARLKWEGGEHAFGEGRTFANRLCFPQDPVDEPEFTALADEILGKLKEQLAT